jgi:small conductance mechanosensitive channel
VLAKEISLFTTEIKTFDNQQFIIPNGKIWGEDITNRRHFPVRGIEMRFDVAHGEDFDKSRAVILASLEPPCT